MRASELMAERTVLVSRLTRVDDELANLFGQPRTYTHAAEVRALLNLRRTITREMKSVGYQPWPVPVDERESRVS